MKVLVLSAESWRDDSNGGNVLSNLFEKLPYTFAQVYCNPEKPFNRICKDYYQITDRDVVEAILYRKKSVGNVQHFDFYPDKKSDWTNGAGKTGLYAVAKKLRFESLYVAQEIVWGLAPLENKQLEKFVNDFNPDIIFAPCYASHRMLKLTRYIARITNKPIISYISDDNYSLKQFRFSPIYWVNRLVLRKHMRATIPMYSLLYTMTEEQKEELERVFQVPIKVLRKHGDFSADFVRAERSLNTIHMIYAGGIYLNRWKTLAKIVECISRINAEGGTQFRLDIYTNNGLSEVQKRQLSSPYSGIHNAVPFAELQKLYSNADIAIHCESFDTKYKYDTRLSFSTKIIDCLHSGCAVMALAWKRHSGLIYLKREDAAICVESLSEIGPVLQRIKESPTLVDEYSKKAWLCGRKNHNSKDIIEMLDNDFQSMSHER